MNEIVKIENNEIIIKEEFIKKYKEFKKVQLEMEIAEKEFKEELKNAMELIGKENIILDGFSASLRKGSTRTTLDTARIKKWGALLPIFHIVLRQQSRLKNKHS